MTRTLIRIFNPKIQIEALAIVCQTLKKASQVKCLLRFYFAPASAYHNRADFIADVDRTLAWSKQSE